MEWTSDKKGFLIKKSSISDTEAVRKKLTVHPFQCKGYGKGDGEANYFRVFTETEEVIKVPKFWASETFNVPQPRPSPDLVIPCNSFTGSLRPIQEEIVDTVMTGLRSAGGGILSAQCGQGKTVMAIHILCQLRVKTLIVVNKQQLLLQWKERIAFFAPGLQVGTIQQKKVDIEGKHVVLGMLQSLSMKDYPPEVYECFDLMVVDEVHNISTRTFSRTLLKLSPPYTLGLSATPQRPDGTSKVFHWFLGPMLYRLSAKEAAAMVTRQAAVSVHIVPYTEKASSSFREVCNAKGDVLLSTMISNVAGIEKRNKKIIDVLVSLLHKAPTRSVLILSSRIQQLRDLKDILTARMPQLKTSLYVGSMKASELQEALVDSQVLLGSYELICEGFDYPRLNTLVFATPRSRIEQAVGRILRKPDPAVPPLVVDVVDDLPSFKAQGLKRRKFYKALGYSIIESPL